MTTATRMCARRVQRTLRLVLGSLTFVALATLAPRLAATDGEVELRVSPPIVRAPGNVNIFVHVPRQADNRLLRVTLDSGDFYRSSDVQLEGDRGPIRYMLAWRDIAAGTYDVVAEVHGPQNTKKIVRRPLHVVGTDVKR